MRGPQYRSDEAMDKATAAIKSALVKRKRPIDGVEFYDLMSRVRIAPDGAVMLELPELRHAADDRQPAFIPGQPPWLECINKVFPIDEGVRVYFGDRSCVEIWRRQYVLAEEDRRLALRQEAQRAADVEARRLAAIENQKLDAWNAMSPTARAKRRGPFAEVAAFIEALEREEAAYTKPPADWIPEPIDLKPRAGVGEVFNPARQFSKASPNGALVAPLSKNNPGKEPSGYSQEA